MKRLRQRVAASAPGFPLRDDVSDELCIENLSHHWPNGQQALRGCNLTVPGRGLWMLVGSNGSGKSTLFRLIAGLMEPQSGRIKRPGKAAMVFQNPDHQLLLPSCGSDLMLGMSAEKSQQQRMDQVIELLQRLGLDDLINRPIHTLSGGQKQRLAIAGALASEARLLLLDEPTALLDPESQRTVLNTVQELCQKSSDPITALWITHRLEELDHSNGAAQMTDGRIGPWMPGEQLRLRLQDGRSDR